MAADAALPGMAPAAGHPGVRRQRILVFRTLLPSASAAAARNPHGGMAAVLHRTLQRSHSFLPEPGAAGAVQPGRRAPVNQPSAGQYRAEIVVIGSGPGGSTTAHLLAEHGRDVLILEAGPDLPLESCPPFSAEEMVQKYRAGGLNPTVGNAKVVFAEGRCVGGGSEVNSGL